MSRRGYSPDRGDLVWMTLNPTAGHEQAGRRPVLVLSTKEYNRTTGLCVVCPATRQEKGYAFEVAIENSDGKLTVILADHLRSVDWRARKTQFIAPVPKSALAKVLARVEALLINPDA